MLSKKAISVFFFSFMCLFKRIHAQPLPPKKRHWREYCAETMHDKKKRKKKKRYIKSYKRFTLNVLIVSNKISQSRSDLLYTRNGVRDFFYLNIIGDLKTRKKMR